MKTRWLRITLIAAAVPVLLCGLLLAVIATLGNTAGGRQRIESLVAYLTASQVRLQGLGGDLPDHLTLRTLQLSDTHGVWLTAADIDLHWHPWALLQRHVALETVHARRIDWLRAPVFGSRDAGPRRIPDIDVRELTGDTVNLSAALAVTAATLNLHASAHLRTLEDMQLAVAATRLDGEGTYSLQLAFDKARMDGAFRLREPLHGPLAGLLGVPDVGAVQVAGDLGGLRQAERLAVHADVGALHADVTGAVDLRQGSADLDYAADAGAMAPRADLSWRRLHLRGTWRGTPATALATGELQVLDLAAPHALRIASLDAALQAHGGDLRVQGKVSGLAAPGLPTGLFEVAPLDLAGGIDFASPSRPFSLHASHPVFTVRATGQAAGERFVDAAFDTRDVAVLLQALPGQLRGPLHLAARAQLTGERVQMRVTAAGNLDSGLIGLQPWLRGPQSADIRASYQEHELTFSPSAAASKALGLAVSGRLAAPTRPDEPWSVAAKARVTLEDLALLLPSLSGKAAIR
ncbi:MAG TPA: hypothetical protein VMC02_09300, partial [Steroidobacteraceae bacterium]|nr:hypothetical protein [Steroidobacteraceae bacterium]